MYPLYSASACLTLLVLQTSYLSFLLNLFAGVNDMKFIETQEDPKIKILEKGKEDLKEKNIKDES